MAVIGSLAVSIVAKTKQFNRGIAESRTGTRSLVSAVAKVGPAAAAGLAAASAAFVRFARDQAQAIDATSKLSDRINISTENLRGLEHAAQINGVTSAKLNTGLRDMVRRLGEAKDGSGEAAGTLQKLGLSVDRLLELKADEQFIAISEAISRLSTRAEQSAAAYDVFGRSGSDMINLITQQRGAIRDLIADNDALGNSFSRELGRKVEESNDAVTRAQTAWKGFKTQLSIATAPAFTKFFNDLADGVAVVNRDLFGTADATERLADQEERINSALGAQIDLRKQIEEKQGRELANRILQAQKLEAEEERRKKSFFESQLSSIDSELRRINFGETGGRIADIRATLGTSERTEELIGEVKRLDAARKKQEELKRAEEARLELVERAGEIRNGLLSKEEQLNKQIAEIQELRSQGLLSAREAAAAIRQAGKAIGKETRTKTLTAALTEGSQEARSASLRNLRPESKSLSEVAANTAELIEIQEDMLEAFKDDVGVLTKPFP